MSRILKVDPHIFLFGLRINLQCRWAALFVGKYGIVLAGAGDGMSEESGRCEGCGDISTELSEDDGMNLLCPACIRLGFDDEHPAPPKEAPDAR